MEMDKERLQIMYEQNILPVFIILSMTLALMGLDYVPPAISKLRKVFK